MRYVDLGAVNALTKKEQKPKKNIKKPLVIGIVGVLFFVLLLAFFAVKRIGFSALFNPVSIVTSFVNPSSIKETDGRINILILGLDRRSYTKSGGLTDTILVASVSKTEKNLVMISLPRDLWVKSSGGYSKLNAVYAISGTDDMVKTVQDILGMPIHYYTVIDFNAFKNMIDILGGIDVNVETTFDDYFYPIEGMESAEPEELRYKHLHFDAGLQRMNAATALEFSRSRKGSNGEGTDFARAKRQQKVIIAVRDKALSIETLANPAKIKDLYDTYNKNIETDIGLGEAQKLYEIGRQIGFNEIKSIVLDDRSAQDQGGLLYAPEDRTLYSGQYVLIPRTGDYSQIHAYVLKFLFGE